jgi:hypothetical protein
VFVFQKKKRFSLRTEKFEFLPDFERWTDGCVLEQHDLMETCWVVSLSVMDLDVK